MAELLNIYGDENKVIDLNISKNILNIKKIIITSDIILNNFNEKKILEFFDKMKNSSNEEFENITNEAESENIFSDSLSSEFYKNLQKRLEFLNSNNFEIKIKNYNFMEQIANLRYDIIIRSEGFLISKRFVEKGQILSSIKANLKEYFFLNLNKFRLSRLKIFQIEIFESFDTLKRICLKKEGNKLIIASSFGFIRNEPFNYSIGDEIYFSIGEDFNFFKNSQEKILIKEYNKIIEKDMNSQEKILNNLELKVINEKTKNINDVTIEIEINKKENFRIVHCFGLEDSICSKSDNGFIIYKSSKNYNKIDILTMNLIDQETLNPKYLLLRSNLEIQEFLRNPEILLKVDGLILNKNFYSQILEFLGKKLDIDILFYFPKIQKALEVNINLDKFEIEIKNSEVSNPFRNIISSKEDKLKDSYLNYLENINLDSPIEKKTVEKEDAANFFQNFISSENSSKKEYTQKTQRKSALSMLADNVLQKKEIKTEDKLDEIPKLDFDNFENSELIIKKEKDEIENNYKHLENVLAVRILTSPKIHSRNYFLDSTSIAQTDDFDTIFFMTSEYNFLNNENLNYVLPINLQKEENKNNIYFIVNNSNDFFLTKKNRNNYFFNLSFIPNEIKCEYLKEISLNFKRFSLIILKEDLNLMKDIINKIDNVLIKDVNQIEEFEKIKEDVLRLEKKFLIK